MRLPLSCILAHQLRLMFMGAELLLMWLMVISPLKQSLSCSTLYRVLWSMAVGDIIGVLFFFPLCRHPPPEEEAEGAMDDTSYPVLIPLFLIWKWRNYTFNFTLVWREAQLGWWTWSHTKVSLRNWDTQHTDGTAFTGIKVCGWEGERCSPIHPSIFPSFPPYFFKVRPSYICQAKSRWIIH